MNRSDFSTRTFGSLLRRTPSAVAKMKGSIAYPSISGWVTFYPTEFGCLVAAEIQGLPHTEGHCQGNFFGFHIHTGGSCTGTEQDPFADTGPHYNPDQCPHPQHPGDMPNLMEYDGRAWMAVLNGRLDLEEVIGRTVIIHAGPDDYSAAPFGNAGHRMACGIILAM